MTKCPITNRPYRMINQVQHYAWGTRNAAAYIPQLLNFQPEPDRPYAELWMGAHPSGPSAIVIGDQSYPLDKAIGQWMEPLIGRSVADRFCGELPFLFKVLSVGEPLSIQLHPDAAEAAGLHEKDPEHFPDARHKPEIAIALDRLDLLAGCKPPEAMKDTLVRYPEIRMFAESKAVDRLKATGGRENADGATVRAFLQHLIERSVSHGDLMRLSADMLYRRLKKEKPDPGTIEALYIACFDKYGSEDPGLFALYLLNRLELKAGEAIFLSAGIPHAYLQGNLVECMANSDNVVRMGLTPKHKDLPILAALLQCGQPVLLKPGSSPDRTIYAAPAEAFRVIRHKFPGGKTWPVNTQKKPEILLISEGEASVRWDDGKQETFRRGESIFIPACLTEYTLGGTAETMVFRAYIP